MMPFFKQSSSHQALCQKTARQATDQQEKGLLVACKACQDSDTVVFDGNKLS